MRKLRFTQRIAVVVVWQAQAEGLAEQTTADELEKRIDATVWQPEYLPI